MAVLSPIDGATAAKLRPRDGTTVATLLNFPTDGAAVHWAQTSLGSATLLQNLRRGEASCERVSFFVLNQRDGARFLRFAQGY